MNPPLHASMARQFGEPAKVVDLRNAPLLRVRAFGTLRVDAPLGRFGVRDLGGIKPKQVLELLVLARRTSITKSQFADVLWGATPPKNISGTLENYVSVLRRKLIGAGPEARQAIRTEHEAYCLSSAHVSCDLDVFDDLLRARTQATNVEEALDVLERAVSLASGSVFEDEPYADWVALERDRYRQRSLSARLDAGELSIALDRAQGAQDHAEAALQIDPYDERAVRLQMRASVALGRARAALGAYERCRRILSDELGIEPDTATKALHDRIIRNEGADPTGDPAPSVYGGPERRSLRSVPLPRSSEQLSPNGVHALPPVAKSHAALSAAMESSPSPVSAPSSVGPSWPAPSAREGLSLSVPGTPSPQHPSMGGGPTAVDETALQVLLSACVLAHARGGPTAMLRLLNEASTLGRELTNLYGHGSGHTEHMRAEAPDSAIARLQGLLDLRSVPSPA